MSKVRTQLVIEGRNNSGRAFKEVETQLEGMNKKLATAGRALKAAFSVAAMAGALRSISSTADAYNLMNARLKLATESQDEFNYAQTELQRIATATQAPIESLVTLYTRISRPLKEAGRSQQDILKVTEAVSTSFRISGASATEAQNGVIQFAQALGAGALRGDEFNSVAEQAPRLMQALADSLGVPTGALKDMAAAGELTAAVVTDALVGQLDVLRQEAESLPETVGGAMTAAMDKWNKAIGEADMQPLIGAIGRLGDTLSDPAVVQNLTALVSALVTLAGTVTDGASEFADLGNRIGYMAAKAAGATTELDEIDQRLKDIDRAITGTGLNRTMDSFIYSKEELASEREALKQRRAMVMEELTGISAEAEAEAARANEAAEEARQADVRSFNKYIGELKALQGEQLKLVGGALKEQVAEEKKAQAEIEKIRNKRLQIEQRYNEALAGLGQGDAEPTYALAQDLKLKSMQALANKDVAAAQAYAQQALQVLQEMDKAGANTYGFEGFIKQLRSIELAANDLEQTNAEQKLADIRTNMEELKKQAADLEELKVSFNMDDAQLEKVRSQIQALAKQLGQELTLPVRVVSPDGVDVTDIEKRLSSTPGFASGGRITGPGTGTSDSILARLSNGEYVVKAAAVRKYGTQMLDQLNGMRLPKFADGGLVGSMTPASSGTPLNLTLDGQTYSLKGSPDTIDLLARAVRTAKLKRG